MTVGGAYAFDQAPDRSTADANARSVPLFPAEGFARGGEILAVGLKGGHYDVNVGYRF